jgi:3-methyladenine DNA glycosylase AlkC
MLSNFVYKFAEIKIYCTMSEKEKFSLKDHLYNAPKVAFLAEAIKNVYPSFEKEHFEQEILAEFPNLELKERIAHIRNCLKKYLPQDYRQAVNVILKALPAPLDESRTDDDFGDFIHAPYNDFVAHFGCTEADLHFSLAAIKEITKRFSAEDAIRYFINAFPDETMKTLLEWTSNSNYHVRRLCSEGTRPKLPWSQKINIAPEQTLPILDKLFADKTRYVTRSVANHLNDFAKIQSEIVLNTLENWSKSSKQQTTEMAFITKHSLRTLVKNGNENALSMLGFGNSEGITISDLSHDNEVKIDDYLNFSFKINTKQAKNVVIDYLIYFQSKQGTLSNKKVFKLQAVDMTADQTIDISKRHFFKGDMTTRKLYAGAHRAEIQVNGMVLEGFGFNLSPT